MLTEEEILKVEAGLRDGQPFMGLLAGIGKDPRFGRRSKNIFRPDDGMTDLHHWLLENCDERFMKAKLG